MVQKSQPAPHIFTHRRGCGVHTGGLHIDGGVHVGLHIDGGAHVGVYMVGVQTSGGEHTLG